MTNSEEQHRAAPAEPGYRLISIDGDASDELWELSPTIAEAAATAVGQGQSPPTVVMRRQRPYALLGPKDRRLPSLAAGVAVLREAGLPVYERIAGGTAVILDEGCVSFAVAKPCRDFTLIRRNFEEMTVGVRLALKRLGIESEFGAAPGSFCEGPYDLVSDGRKIAGIAQAMRQGFALVSGMLIVSQDPVPVTELLNRFYEAAGGVPDLIPDNVVTLSGLLGRSVSLEEVEEALKQGFAEAHGLQAGTPTAHELALARKLLGDRRLG